MKKKLCITLFMTGVLLGCTNHSHLDISYENNNQMYETLLPLDSAISLANTTLATLYNNTTRSSSIEIESATTISPKDTGYKGEGDDTPSFYIINYANNGGFVILSTNYNNPLVYAFSDKGHISLSDTIENPSLKEYLTTINTPSNSDNNNEIIDNKGNIQIITHPLLTPNMRDWSQGALNKYVKIGRYETTPVGCVALATGLIMAYNNCPTHWPLDTTSNSVERYEFNWNILNNYTVHDDIARFMEILGRPQYFNMRYGETESLASMDSTLHVFQKLGYDTISHTQFNPTIAWMQLHKKKPLLIAAKKPFGIGHAFVIDGYAKKEPRVVSSNQKTYEYFHFVWGNWGATNGFYLYDPSKKVFSQTPDLCLDGEGSSEGFSENFSYYLMYYDFVKSK